MLPFLVVHLAPQRFIPFSEAFNLLQRNRHATVAPMIRHRIMSNAKKPCGERAAAIAGETCERAGENLTGQVFCLLRATDATQAVPIDAWKVFLVDGLERGRISTGACDGLCYLVYGFLH